MPAEGREPVNESPRAHAGPRGSVQQLPAHLRVPTSTDSQKREPASQSPEQQLGKK